MRIPKSRGPLVVIALSISLGIVISVSGFAQVLADSSFLPTIRKAQVVAPGGEGTAAILQAGLFKWDEQSTDPPVTDQPVPPTEEEPNEPEVSTISGPNGSSLECTIQNWEETGSLETRTIVALDGDPAIFPGALIQGDSLLDGELAQIRGIPRAAGRIYLTNLTLAPDQDPSSEQDPLYTRDIEEISGAAVNEAIQDILTSETLGTAAQFDYSEEVGYSQEQIKFAMGVDGRFPSASFDVDLDVSTDNQKSYSYLLFTQIFYDVIFDSWTSPTSLFADGEKFTDPNGEIGPDNPPLYVEKVSYGRQVLFVLESDYSATDVKAAMQAAYDGIAADVNFSADLTYRKVMENTRVKYRVRGGDASVALKAIDTAGPNEMFDAVKKSLSDKATATYSSANPGVPIYYTLRYLADAHFATMDRAVRYAKRDCVYEQGPGPLQGTTFFVDGFHDKITVSQVWIGDVSQAQFTLQSAPAVTWWKGLEIGSRILFLETQDQQHGPVNSPRYALSQFSGDTVPLSFWKAKGLGTHTYLETKQFGKSDLAGYRTTFYWNND